MKYNVGDKVKVRKDLEVGESYSGILFFHSMDKYKGKEMTIEWTSDADHYLLVEDDGGYSWIDEMFEGLAEEEEVYHAELMKKETMVRNINIYIDKVKQSPLLIDIINKIGYGYKIYADSMIIKVDDKLSFFETLFIGLEIDYVIKGGSKKVLDN